jgi:hypothetical protein
MNWYYESGGQQQGPVTDADLDRLLAEGKITLDTLVWKDGMAGWTPLRSARAAVPPPVPAAADAGWEITRPAGSVASTPSPTQGSDVPEPGWIRCSLTGRYFPPSEIIYLEGKPYSAAAKPQVVASMQSGVSLPSGEVGRDGPAWENRRQIGFFPALIQTIKAVLLEPTRTFTTMRREGGLQDPLIFNLIVGSVGGIFFQILIGVAQLAMVGSLGGQQSNLGAAMVGGVAGMVIGIIMIPVQIALGAFLGSGVLHLCLMLLKGAPQPFETTFRAMNYAYGGLAALYLVPIIGWLAMIPWSIAVVIIATARAQEIPTGKAALAVFLPIIVCCGVGGIIAVAIGALTAAGNSLQ